VKEGQREREPRHGRQGLQPEQVWLNSWNSNNSYSERGQHRGTRRCGSRWAPSSRACPQGQRFTPPLSTRRPVCGTWFTSSGSCRRRKVCACAAPDTWRSNLVAVLWSDCDPVCFEVRVERDRICGRPSPYRLCAGSKALPGLVCMSRFMPIWTLSAWPWFRRVN